MVRSPVGEFSRGQLQQVLYARLLVQQVRLVQLDEPFTCHYPTAAEVNSSTV